MVLHNMPNSIENIVNDVFQHAELIVRLFSEERSSENVQEIATELVKWDVNITSCFKTHSDELIKADADKLIALHSQVTELARNEKQRLADDITNLDKGKKAVAAYTKNKY